MGERTASAPTIPFGVEDELFTQFKYDSADPTVLTRQDGVSTLPGSLFVRLDYREIKNYLSDNLETTELNSFGNFYFFITTPSSSSITPLHQQGALGRSISIHNSAHLHLVWYHDRIFIKPLPQYLFSHTFWEFLFAVNREKAIDGEQQRLNKAAVGFIRSYAFLIRDQLDFDLAVEFKLIPEGITADAFAKFMNKFLYIADHAVTTRFRYGELRLSRLNLWAPLALGRLEYYNTKRQSDSYFSRYFSPLLFAFALVSVLLSAMQVALATEQSPGTFAGSWEVFANVCRWVAVGSIIVFVFLASLLLVLFLLRNINEYQFAIKASLRSRRRRNGSGS